MRTKPLSILISGMLACAVPGLTARSQTPTLPKAGWILPQGLAVQDAGPRTYRFTVDYNSANTNGVIFQRQRIAADYTRGLPGGDVMWSNATLATASGATAPFGDAQKLDYVDGFRYHNDLDAPFRPDFFKTFPSDAFLERNLVWDTGMIEMFGQNHFDRLKLNEPYHALSDSDVNLPGVGTFHNHDVVLEWVGLSRRNGEDCALIDYQAFFNPLEIAAAGINMQGRSDYWGEIWVSLTTKQIAYATLNESVVALLKLPGQDAPQVINIFRSGTFEPVSAQ